jgi:hypothetical protein
MSSLSRPWTQLVHCFMTLMILPCFLPLLSFFPLPQPRATALESDNPLADSTEIGAFRAGPAGVSDYLDE